MSTVVSFPGLGLEFTVNRVAFSIGGFDIYWYGILIGLGLALGMIYALRHAREFGIDADRMLDVVIAGTIFGVIGARLYYVAFAPQGMFNSFADILNMRKGGVAFYGAVIGAVLAALLTCGWRKVKLLPMIDVATVGFLVGQGIGRWGNFFNQEAFGTNTTLPWGMTSETIVNYLRNNAEMLQSHNIFVDPTMPVHPTFLYESVWCLLGALVFILYAKRRRFDGEMALMFLAWNGFGRAFIEGLRTDSLYIGEYRVSQILAILCAALAVLTICFIRLRISRKADPAYLMPYGHTEKCAEDLALLEKERQKKNKKGETQPQEETRATAQAEELTKSAKPVPAAHEIGEKPAKPVSRKLDALGNEIDQADAARQQPSDSSPQEQPADAEEEVKGGE